jgi:hypothetical protein
MLRFATQERNAVVAVVHDVRGFDCNSIRSRTRATRRAADRGSALFSTIQSTATGDMVTHDDARRETIVDATETASGSSERRAPDARIVPRGVGLVRVDRRRTRHVGT